MKGITLISSKGLTYEEISPIIKNAFKDLKIESDEAPRGEEGGYLYLGKSPRSLAIYFSPSERLCTEDGFEDQELNRIPFEPFATDVSFRIYAIVCRLVKVIVELCPELYICDDQEDFLGPANEFLERHSNNI